MSSVAAVAAALRSFVESVARNRAQIAAAIVATVSSGRHLAEITRGSPHPLAQDASQRVAAAVQRLEEADRLAAGAAAAVVEYGRGLGINLPPPSPPQRSALAAHVSSTAQKPEALPPEKVLSVGRRLPIRAGPRDRTTGVFNGETIASGEDTATVADLRPFAGGGWPDAVISHVESHVAARMRRQNLTSGEVVLNNITCGNRGFDDDWPATCERYIRALLPAGSRLTVWATPDSGATWWTKTYVGTGERIRR